MFNWKPDFLAQQWNAAKYTDLVRSNTRWLTAA